MGMDDARVKSSKVLAEIGIGASRACASGPRRTEPGGGRDYLTDPAACVIRWWRSYPRLCHQSICDSQLSSRTAYE